MIKKYIKRGVMTALLVACLSVGSYASSFETAPIKLLVNGELQSYGTAPENINGTVFVPMRDICETLGAEVEWSAERKEIKAEANGDSMLIKIGSVNAFVNNSMKTLLAAPYIQDGTTMVPVRFVSEAFGAKVKWDSSSRTVSIEANKGANAGTVSDKAQGNEDTFLSYDEAMKKGIQKSSAYNSAVLGGVRAKEANDDFPYTQGSYSFAMLQAKKDLNLQEKWTEMQLPLIADATGNNIKNMMDSLTLKLKERDLLQENITFLEYKLRLENLKYSAGLISKVQLDKAEASFSKEKIALNILNQEIIGERAKLNNALGSPSEQILDFEYSTSYSPVGAVDLDRKVKDNLGSDPYIWLAKESAASKEFKLLTYEYNILGGQSYLMTQLDLTEAKRSLKDMENSLETTIRTRYNTLLTLEENIANLETDLTETKRAVNALWLQYDLGMITKAELQEMQLNIPKIELGIETLKKQHEQYKVLFERPYLMPEYASQS
ncbi:MAG: stalk domain-containing protein [Eubacteriales bacterium]|nr:stalk domain-containing protein [Eubacteriales bacterium]